MLICNQFRCSRFSVLFQRKNIVLVFFIFKLQKANPKSRKNSHKYNSPIKSSRPEFRLFRSHSFVDLSKLSCYNDNHGFPELNNLKKKVTWSRSTESCNKSTVDFNGSVFWKFSLTIPQSFYFHTNLSPYNSPYNTVMSNMSMKYNQYDIHRTV